MILNILDTRPKPLILDLIFHRKKNKQREDNSYFASKYFNKILPGFIVKI